MLRLVVRVRLLTLAYTAMRTAQERIASIIRATRHQFSSASFGELGDIAQVINTIALNAALGWHTLVNGIPGQDEWLEISSHENTGASDVVVILKQALVNEYLASLAGQHADYLDVADRITVIDAYMQKAMAAHNVCPTV